MVKKVFYNKPEERRQVGRPGLRWLEDVNKKSLTLKVKMWRQKATNITEWASVIK